MAVCAAVTNVGDPSPGVAVGEASSPRVKAWSMLCVGGSESAGVGERPRPRCFESEGESSMRCEAPSSSPHESALDREGSRCAADELPPSRRWSMTLDAPGDERPSEVGEVPMRRMRSPSCAGGGEHLRVSPVRRGETRETRTMANGAQLVTAQAKPAVATMKLALPTLLAKKVPNRSTEKSVLEMAHRSGNDSHANGTRGRNPLRRSSADEVVALENPPPRSFLEAGTLGATSGGRTMDVTSDTTECHSMALVPARVAISRTSSGACASSVPASPHLVLT